MVNPHAPSFLDLLCFQPSGGFWAVYRSYITSNIVRAAWQDRNLTWGNDTSYVPDDITSQWMNVVYGESSPIVEVLAGHLHLTWDGMIKEKTHQHVFSQAFSGYVGLITVNGDEK